jgi:hypothetical protein
MIVPDDAPDSAEVMDVNLTAPAILLVKLTVRFGVCENAKQVIIVK